MPNPSHTPETEPLLPSPSKFHPSRTTSTSLLSILTTHLSLPNTTPSTALLNPDIIPLPPSRRIWGPLQYLSFFSAAQFTITSWSTAAAILTLSLSVPSILAAMFVTELAVVVFATATGSVGSSWHVSFPVSQRFVLGIRGSYIAVAMRVLLSVVWYGMQAWLGGLCVAAALSSCSRAFLSIPTTTTRGFVGFAIFQAVAAPLMWFRRPETAARALAVANCMSLAVMLYITAWACRAAGGLDAVLRAAPTPTTPPGSTTTTTTATSNSSAAWTWFYAVTSGIGGISAGILNQSDYTRFARRPGAQVPGLAIATFVPGSVVPLMSILTASATRTIWPDSPSSPFWDPLSIVEQWLRDDYSPGTRAAALACALGLTCSQLAENVMGNGYAAGMDLAGLFPRYVDVRRGSVACAVLSCAVRPWLLYGAPSVFIAAMASFSVLLAPLTGIVVTDYFLLRKQKIELSALYTLSPEGSYYFTRGFNPRSIAVWAACSVPAVPGMVARLAPSVHVPGWLVRYNQGNYFFGFVSASLVYYAVVRAWPPTGLGKCDRDDVYGTFTRDEALQKGIIPSQVPRLVGDQVGESLHSPADAAGGCGRDA